MPPKLIFAADAVDQPDELLYACEVIMESFPDVMVKFGLGWTMTHGLKMLAEQDWLDPSRLFLDLKILDIGETMKRALKGTLANFDGKAPVGMINIHAQKGTKHMKVIADYLRTISPQTRLIGVTVLTDMDQDDLNSDMGLSLYEQSNFTPGNLAIVRAQAAMEAGLAGVVCSPQEVKAIKQACGPSFLTVVPGIRPAGGSVHDQKRVGTPAQAAADGADFVVGGRPIWEAPYRVEAVREILQEMAAARP